MKRPFPGIGAAQADQPHRLAAHSVNKTAGDIVDQAKRPSADFAVILPIIPEGKRHGIKSRKIRQRQAMLGDVDGVFAGSNSMITCYL